MRIIIILSLFAMCVNGPSQLLAMQEKQQKVRAASPITPQERVQLASTDKDKKSARQLCLYALNGHKKHIQELLNKSKNIVRKQGKSEKEVQETIGKLINSPVLERQMTPLMGAIASGKPEIVSLLLHEMPSTISIKTKDKNGVSAAGYLQLVVDKDSKNEILKILQERMKQENAATIKPGE